MGGNDVRWLDEREARAWRAVQGMTMRLNARLAADVGASSDLSYADYVVLMVLSDQPEGRMRVFELARGLGWEKSRVSHQIARMVDRGLVRKEKCGADRRGAYVVIVPRGRKAIEAAAPRHVETVRRLFIDRLTPDQLDALAEAAETVLEVIEAEEQAVCDELDASARA